MPVTSQMRQASLLLDLCIWYNRRMDKNKVEMLQQMIDACSRIAFFGGAGVSTESGIPDFRSKDGLYNQRDVQFDAYTPEYLLSRDCLYDNSKVFFEYYRQKMNVEGIEPNAAHKKLAELERAGKLAGIATQNIDGLHQKAGSKVVYELHGSTLRNYCARCGKILPPDYIFHTLNAAHDGRENALPQGYAPAEGGIPRCPDCGGFVRPDVTLYGEALPEDAWSGAVRMIAAADMLIIGGTSLAVYPAASLVDYFSGKYLVVINRDAGPRDAEAQLVLRDRIGEVFSQIKGE